ncbi:BC85_0335 family putative methyltransferase [Mycoplasma crocodyli]|uniref:Uncharacterized protein n=1 Tax=Mycoplasma crocodyli (strain ATCC 51981 / MP145) TaxID=512564 RepID=D5E530_MYCCM|nr:hypothetical protein [Mycoplasma crocodyli]ADE19452.1 conserved hypothetical protein [Mycoplasma crocodyli MP145]
MSGIRLGLTISVVIVVVIAVVSVIGLRIAIARLRKKELKKDYQSMIKDLDNVREDAETLPFVLKDFYKSKTQDYDIESFINTIYKNNYKDVLVDYYNDNFVLAAIQEKCKISCFFDVNNFDIVSWNNAFEKFPTHINFTPKQYNNEELDLAIIKSKDLSNKEIFDTYFIKIKEKGMLIIDQKNQSKIDLMTIIKHLENNNIKHEVSFVKSKFLYIVK